MALVRREPERELMRWGPGFGMPMEFSDFRREIDRVFNRMLGGGTSEEGTMTAPLVDIVERENEYLVKADLPGVRQDDVKITLTNDVLTIRGERRQEQQVDDRNYYRSERSIGVFQRSFTLPSAVQSDNIEATFEDGVLTVQIPKAEAAKAREIHVKRGSQASGEAGTPGKRGKVH